jgi:hypothetical protein
VRRGCVSGAAREEDGVAASGGLLAGMGSAAKGITEAGNRPVTTHRGSQCNGRMDSGVHDGSYPPLFPSASRRGTRQNPAHLAVVPEE